MMNVERRMMAGEYRYGEHQRQSTTPQASTFLVGHSTFARLSAPPGPAVHCVARMLRTTPFHSRTAPLCQAQDWRRWAGYIVASSYEPAVEREYYAIRSSAALIDVSPLYKYLVHG